MRCRLLKERRLLLLLVQRRVRGEWRREVGGDLGHNAAQGRWTAVAYVTKDEVQTAEGEAAAAPAEESLGLLGLWWVRVQQSIFPMGRLQQQQWQVGVGPNRTLRQLDGCCF